MGQLFNRKILIENKGTPPDQWCSQGLPRWVTCPPGGPKWRQNWKKVWGKIRKKWLKFEKNEESGTLAHTGL